MTTGIVINLVALSLAIGWVLSHIWPATEAVRVRNAYLLDPSEPGDFDWSGPGFPADFRVETRPPDPFFVQVVRSICGDGRTDEWACAIALAAHLAQNAQDKGPIQSDLKGCYAAIREGFGYCADFVKVYIALAHAAKIPVRQWAFSFDGFGGHGHTLVEVWDSRRGKWLLIDVHNNVHLIDEASGEPVSALEFRDFLLARRGPMTIAPNGDGRAGFRHHVKYLDYCRRGANEWYLWWGNAIYSYFAHPMVKLAGHVSNGAAHVAAFLCGEHPHFRVVPNTENTYQIAQIRALRGQVLGACFVIAMLVALLIAQILLHPAR